MSLYTQKHTPDPISALKITIYSTKHTKNTQMYFQTSKMCKSFGNQNRLSYYILTSHNSYFVYSVFLYILYILYLLYLYIPIFALPFSKECPYWAPPLLWQRLRRRHRRRHRRQTAPPLAEVVAWRCLSPNDYTVLTARLTANDIWLGRTCSKGSKW